MGVEQIVDRLAIENGQVLLEIGADSDCDKELQSAICSRTGNEFIHGDPNEVVDAVILWWREEDGDLVDQLVDALTFLSETGPIWLLTPKMGRSGYVEPSDIQDGAPTAGLSQTVSFSAGADWTATRLVARRANRK